MSEFSGGKFMPKIEPVAPVKTPIVITLQSRTVPVITVKLNSWKYEHSQNDTKEDFESHMQYFYDEHTCPTNWTSEIEEISVGADHDPHGIFEFVSAEDGHLDHNGELVPEAREDQ